MKQATVTIKFEEEKLGAVKQYMNKKDVKLEDEMNDFLEKLYEKHVPQAVREYIESRGEVPPVMKRSAQAQAASKEILNRNQQE